MATGAWLLLAACRSNTGPAKAGASSASPADGWSVLPAQVVTGDPAMGEKETGGTAVVVLHGWGAPADDLVPLARELAGPRMRLIVPAAPLPHPAGGRAWWPLDLARRQRAMNEGAEGADRDGQLARQLAEEVPPGLASARAKVQQLLRQVRDRYRPDTLALVGFSQGGMLATDVALAADPPLDQLASLSGTLLAESLWRGRLKAAARKPRVFLSHGRQDAVLPFSGSERLRELLAEGGLDVTWVPFDGGHDIPDQVVARLRSFLAGPAR